MSSIIFDFSIKILSVFTLSSATIEDFPLFSVVFSNSLPNSTDSSALASSFYFGVLCGLFSLGNAHAPISKSIFSMLIIYNR